MGEKLGKCAGKASTAWMRIFATSLAGNGTYCERYSFSGLIQKDEQKLVDFEYTNHDIESLRRQMEIPAHVSSPLSEGSPGQ